MLLFSSVSISWRQGFCCKYYLSLSKVETFSKTQPGLVGTKSLNDLCIRICFSIQSRISYMKFKNPENCREETVSYGWFEVQFLAGNLPSAWLAVRWEDEESFLPIIRLPLWELVPDLVVSRKRWDRLAGRMFFAAFWLPDGLACSLVWLCHMTMWLNQLEHLTGRHPCRDLGNPGSAAYCMEPSCST